MNTIMDLDMFLFGGLFCDFFIDFSAAAGLLLLLLWFLHVFDDS